MDENTAPNFAVKNSKIKNIARSGPLSLINGDINNRKRTINAIKGNSKPLKQEKSVINPYLLTKHTFQIFEDDTQNKRSHEENVVAASSESSSANSSPSENCPSSPECIGLSPEVQSDTLFSYAKRKKEKLSSDLTWCTPYRKDIYNYFIEIEKNFRPNPDYMLKQQDLNLQMRSILVDWMIEVGIEYKLRPETLHFAVSYVDRFLSQVAVLRGKLQLVGTASMFLAVKYEEIYPPELSDFVFITDNTYTKKQILRMEHLILKVLNFEISAPTAYTFLQLFCSMCNAPDILMNLSQYICELTLLDGEFLMFSPSYIAAGSLALSNYILGNDMWDERMEKFTSLRHDTLYFVIVKLFNLLISMPTRSQQAIREKYKSPKYGSVSTMKYPKSLDFESKKPKGMN